MTYRQNRSIREAYENRFSGMDTREVTVHRVVNIVDDRNRMPRQEMDYDRRFQDNQWGSGSRNYRDSRDVCDEGYYHSNDSYCDENPNYLSFMGNPQENEGRHSHQFHSRGSRKLGRPGPNFRSRGRGIGPPRRQVMDIKTNSRGDQDFRIVTRDRSPARSKSAGSNTSSKSSSLDNDQNHTPQQAQQKQKPSVPVSLIHSDSMGDSPNGSEATKEQTPASVVQSEEAAAAAASSVELKVTQEDDSLKTVRLKAIKAKALEIEKHYRQDCETFRMVVKMLVAKEPSLDNLLQAPLDENLLEIKQRCLDSLKHFVKELDKPVEQQPDTSTTAASLKTQE